MSIIQYTCHVKSPMAEYFLQFWAGAMGFVSLLAPEVVGYITSPTPSLAVHRRDDFRKYVSLILSSATVKALLPCSRVFFFSNRSKPIFPHWTLLDFGLFGSFRCRSSIS